MPKDENFCFSVLVGGQELEEVIKDSHSYVEADILGPHSRTERTTDEIDGVEEVQNSSPVLPYKIFIKLSSSTYVDSAYAFVNVDGYSVCRLLLLPGGTKTVHGFRDGNGLREFLFTLPRLSADKTCNSGNKNDKQGRKIGVIEITLKEAVYVRTVYSYDRSRNDHHGAKKRKLEFTQATKRDSNSVTRGRYLMATTKVGQAIGNQRWTKGNKRSHQKDIYEEGERIGNLKLFYRIKTNVVNLGCIDVNDEEDHSCNGDNDNYHDVKLNGKSESGRDESKDHAKELPPMVIDVDQYYSEAKPNWHILKMAKVITISDDDDDDDDDDEKKRKVCVPSNQTWSEKNGVIVIDDSSDFDHDYIDKKPKTHVYSNSSSCINDVDDKKEVLSFINKFTSVPTKQTAKKFCSKESSC